jgi:predicted RNA-binding protein Jag
VKTALSEEKEDEAILEMAEEITNVVEEGTETDEESEWEDATPAPGARAESGPASAIRREKAEHRPGDLNHQAIEAVADEVAEHLFAGLRVKTGLSWRQEERVTLWISLRGRDADMLVGPRAQTLNSVQYLFRTLLHHRIEGDYNVVIDADGYRKRQRSSLESLARKKADQAVNTGRTIRLRPMPAHDRRVIHMLLRRMSESRQKASAKVKTAPSPSSPSANWINNDANAGRLPGHRAHHTRSAARRRTHPGGTASYAALTAAALGRRVGILTSFETNLSLTAFDGAVTIVNYPAPSSTTFENIYTNGCRRQMIYTVAAAPDARPDSPGVAAKSPGAPWPGDGGM